MQQQPRSWNAYFNSFRIYGKPVKTAVVEEPVVMQKKVEIAKSRLETFKAYILQLYNDPRFNHLKKNKVLYGSILATIAALGTAYGIYAHAKARRTTRSRSSSRSKSTSPNDVENTIKTLEQQLQTKAKALDKATVSAISGGSRRKRRRQNRGTRRG